MNKKRVAKEWLYALGFRIPWIVIFIALGEDFFTKSGGRRNLLSGSAEYFTFFDVIIGFIGLFYPYLLFLLVRSVVWAIKTVRQKE